MFIKIYDIFTRNKKIVLITFEVFWIIFFILEKISSNSSVEIPQFIYVNF
jgi:hypothetical protein